eukprot:TRINITY_DN1990_c0_g2_i1.p1 TRINITY_DN1990_c0_g2~~TRINITY_DN1990_c0_g2_i1.p1  ORF type:complete len:509 (-),score=72.27 TRINITY_DN1990_c0_g2_i1:13-1395(-)
MDVYLGWYLSPQDDKMVCGYSILDVVNGLASAFPSHLDQFKYIRNTVVNNQPVEEWFRYDPAQGAVNNYTFYIHATTKDPVQYIYKGESGSLLGYEEAPNYDWFQISFSDYKPGYYNTSAFELPKLCQSLSDPPALSKKTPYLGFVPLGLESAFTSFRDQHQREYVDSTEANARRLIFRQNFARIHAHNQNNSAAGYSLSLSPFADRTQGETFQIQHGFRVTPETLAKAALKKYVPLSKSKAQLPDEVDWKAKGKVSPMKDQGDCGSCWSFGSTGAVESAYAIKHDKMITLSEQFLMDCSWSVGNNACGGGDPFSSYQFVIKRGGGWPTEEKYPYIMNEGMCNKNVQLSGVNVTDYFWVAGEHALMDALANHGPVAVSVSTLPPYGWAFYHTGIYQNWLCNPIVPDHTVLAVGYGSENGQDYWLLKNQWSGYWGMDGYMKIARGADDCGVASYGVLPVVS